MGRVLILVRPLRLTKSLGFLVITPTIPGWTPAKYFTGFASSPHPVAPHILCRIFHPQVWLRCIYQSSTSDSSQRYLPGLWLHLHILYGRTTTQAPAGTGKRRIPGTSPIGRRGEILKVKNSGGQRRRDCDAIRRTDTPAGRRVTRGWAMGRVQRRTQRGWVRPVDQGGDGPASVDTRVGRRSRRGRVNEGGDVEMRGRGRRHVV